MPVDVRSLALVVIAVLALDLRAALGQGDPGADPARRHVQLRADAGGRHVCSAGACRAPPAPAVVLSAIVAVIGWGAWALSDDADGADRDPAAGRAEAAPRPRGPGQQAGGIDDREGAAGGQRARAGGAAGRRIGGVGVGGGVGRRVRRRAGRAAAASTTTTTTTASRPRRRLPPTPRGVTRVVVEQPAFNVRDYLWSGTLGLFAFLGQSHVVLFVTLLPARLGRHLPAQDGQARRTAPEPEEDHRAGARRGHEQIQRYLLVQLATSVVVGVATGLAFYRARPRPTRRSGASSPASPTSFPTSARSSSAALRRWSASSSSTASTRRSSSAPARSRSTPSSATC